MRLVHVLAMSVVLCVAFAAHAQPSVDPDTDAARRHYQKGKELYEASSYDEAVKEFEAAQRIKPMSALEFNIARCYDRLDDADRAIAAYERFMSSRPADPGDSAERIRKLRARKAEAEAEAMRASIERDRQAARKAAEARAASEAHNDKPVDKTVKPDAVDKTAPDDKGEHAATVKPIDKAEIPHDEPPPPPPPRSKAPALTVGALALGALAAGGVLLVVLHNDFVDLQAECAMSCAMSKWASDQKENYLAVGLLGLGGALAVLDIVLWGLASRAPVEATQTAWHVTPLISTGGVGLSLGGRFE